MGNNFNKALYILIGVIIIVIILVKFFFKRSHPVTDLPIRDRLQHKAFLKKTIPIVVKSKTSNNNKIIEKYKKYNSLVKQKANVDFISRGKSYHFTERNELGLMVEDVNNGKKALFTGSFMIRPNSKDDLSKIVKKYDLLITKSFEHINYYYLTGKIDKDINESKLKIKNMMAKTNYKSLEIEFLSRPVKVK